MGTEAALANRRRRDDSYIYPLARPLFIVVGVGLLVFGVVRVVTGDVLGGVISLACSIGPIMLGRSLRADRPDG